MYTAKTLVPILGHKFDIRPSTAMVIDRSLAEAGYRKTGKGRHWPEMDRREAIIFMLACMVAQKPTKAAEDVSVWLSAGGNISFPEKPDTFDLGEWREEGDYREQLWLVEAARSTLPDVEKNKATLVSWMLAVCSLLEAGHITSEGIKLEIWLSHGVARVEFWTKKGHEIEQTFSLASASSGEAPSETAIITTSTINGAALLEVIEFTADASQQMGVEAKG